MLVTKITSPAQVPQSTPERMTDEQLRNECSYIRAEQITRKLLEKGLISAGEYDHIMTENRRVFSPFLADLYPENSLIYRGHRGNM